MSTTRIAADHAVGKFGATTPAIDSTGATLLIAKVTHWNGDLAGVLTDSKGNTWTALTDQQDGASDARSRIFYCISPASVGSGHTCTFNDSGNQIYCVVEFEAFSGGTFTFDSPAASAGSGSGTTQQAGSVTPGTATNVIVFATAFENTATLTVDLGFTIGYQVGLNGASNYGYGGAHLLDASGAKNPTWTYSSGGPHAATIASFSYTAGGGGATINDHNFRGSNRGMGLGAGRGLSFHQHPQISLEAYRREQARKHRELMAKARRVA